MESVVKFKLCPLHRRGTRFMWFVEKKDQSLVYEFDDRENPKAPKETSFDTIDPKEVQRLGIMGNGGEIYFDIQNGQFVMSDGETADVYIKINDSEVCLTDSKVEELIERHEMSFDFNMNNISQSKSKIAGWTIGHSGIASIPDGENIHKIKYDVMYTLPDSGSSYITVNLTSFEEDIPRVELILKHLNRYNTGETSLTKDERATLRIAL